MTEENPHFVGHVEAYRLLETIEDKRIRRFIEYGLTQALLRHVVVREQPSAPFDMKFFAEVLKTMAGKSRVLESIIVGDPDEFRWWPEDDS